MSLCGLDNVVEALKTVGASVDTCDAVDEGLIVDCAGTRDGGHIVESPDTEDLLARGLEVLHDGVDIGIVGQETDPVRIGARVVLLLAIDDERGAAGRRNGSRRCC